MNLTARYFDPQGNQINLRGDDTLENGLVEKYDENGRTELFTGAYVDAALQFCTAAFGSLSASMPDQIAALKSSALGDEAALEAQAAQAITDLEASVDAAVTNIDNTVAAAKARRQAGS